MMSLVRKARGSDAPFWRMVRGVARAVLSIHIPAGGPFRLLFSGLFTVHVVVRETLIWLARFFWFEPLFRSRCDRIGAGFRMERLPYMAGAGSIEIGADVRLSGKSQITFANRVHARPRLTIGDHTFIGHNCTFAIGQAVTIGSHCLLAGGVRIADLDGHPVDFEERRRNAPIAASTIRPVEIGNDVWLGTGVSVLKGVRIGDRSIVGAGSVVSKDLPPDVVAVGNPAKVVKILASAPHAEEAIPAVAGHSRKGQV